ncbi:MAG: phosphodiester glycosidase family protein [Bacilli bacterium]|nr:phosphodiester glycosidase family protein [Bacilli bacterium]
MKKRSKTKKRKIYKSTILFIILDLLAIGGFIMMYGPWPFMRNLYVNTAMKTMDHQYLAKVFYSDEKISEIMNSNYFIEINEEVVLDDIVIDTSPKKSYENEYDEEILTRTPGNEDYKIINIKIGISKGYLIAIYDPTKVALIRSKNFNVGTYGEQIPAMCNRYNGLVCINGGGFNDDTGRGSDIPIGYVIDDGEIVWPSSGWDTARSNMIGFNNEGKLLLLSGATGLEALDAGMTEGLEFGPFLIVNGKPLEIVGDPWGKSPRVAIGQRKDGVVLFLVIDGENYIDGASLQDVVDVLMQYGAYNAANLDGGHSSSLSINGKLYNNPPAIAKRQGGRYVVTGFGLLE